MYTVKKKNLDRMEKVLGHRIYDRYIKLYTLDYCFPNWAKYYIRGWQFSTMNRINVQMNKDVVLRDYQQKVIDHVRENAWGLIESATGSWKSLICIGITAMYHSQTLIVCPTKKLVKEMVDKFKKFTNYEPWTFYSDWKNIKDITITTTASFVADMNWAQQLQGAQVLIVDECDDKISEKFINAICHYDCNVLVWMTWTAGRQDLDKQDLQLIYWPYVKGWDYQMLPTNISQHVYTWTQAEKEMVDFENRASIRTGILKNENRLNAVVNKINELKKDSFLTLILLDRNDDVDNFSKYFPEWLVITGSTKVKDDEIWIEKLRKTWGVIIGSLKKMYRWVDIPEIDNVVIASPVRFENTVVQSIGRALRTAEWKTTVNINVINDSILKNQRYEQAKVCKEVYKKSPEVFYFSHS